MRHQRSCISALTNVKVLYSNE